MTIFLKNKSGSVDAIADFDAENSRITVRSGSKISVKLSSAPTFRSRKSMERKRENVVRNGLLLKDVEFTSLSTAATFVVGSNRDGWITWKNADGKTMAEIFDK